jgi:hypothetical protein
MLKRLIASTLAAASILTSIALPAKAHNEEFNCYAELAERPGHIMYGECVPNPVNKFAFNTAEWYYMEQGLNAAMPYSSEECGTDSNQMSDWDTAIINFQKAYNTADTGSFAEAEALRALLGAQWAKEGMQTGKYNEYGIWVEWTGILSACD